MDQFTGTFASVGALIGTTIMTVILGTFFLKNFLGLFAAVITVFVVNLLYVKWKQDKGNHS
ncbi:hypothetical protein FRY77_30905 [Halomonas sp. MG34]|nr:hypothetical protein [Halomonas sp. MG34]